MPVEMDTVTRKFSEALFSSLIFSFVFLLEKERQEGKTKSAFWNSM